MAMVVCGDFVLFSTALVASLFTVQCGGQLNKFPVNTTSGDVIGKSVTFKGKTIWEFKMVPYAEPPVGDLRFEPPHPKKREAASIDGTVENYVICPQTAAFNTELEQFLVHLVNQSYTVSEDCLYLNIYAPSSITPTMLSPVMVWVHGGRFSGGAGRFYSGRVLAAEYDVVVVTFNYRVGALGFLNTEDEHAVGDFGLRDQILALQWVKDNIENFGGDPTSVTIAGQAAGGASVAQLTISPLAEGLFKRAILQSGGLEKPNACLTDPHKSSASFGKTLGCSTENNQILVECLRTKTWEELVAKQGLFAPACSGGIVPFTQEQLDTSQITSDAAKRLARTDIMVGTTSQEGGLMFSALSTGKSDEVGGIQDNFFEGFLGTLMNQIDVPDSLSLSLKPTVKFFYTDWKNPNSSVARSQKVSDLIGDYFFVVSAVKNINLHSNIPVDTGTRGSSYLYLTKHRPSWMTPKPWRYGADHGDDLFFLFGNPLEYPSLNATAQEKVLSQTVMTYWTNFIKAGDPNVGTGTLVGGRSLVTWPKFDMDGQQYLQLDINMDNSSVDRRLLAERMAFWINYFPARLKYLQNTELQPTCTNESSAIQVATSVTVLIMSTALCSLEWTLNRSIF